MEARGADVDIPGLDPFFGQQILQHLEDHRLAGRFLGSFGPQRLEAVLLQAQAAGLVNLELGQLQAARTEING